MTTYASNIKTPYDSPMDWPLLSREERLMGQAGYRLGVLGERAKAAALLEALQANVAIVDWWLSTSWMQQKGVGDDFIGQAKDARNKAHAAIAAVTGKE